jgi:hypothetical protein
MNQKNPDELPTTLAGMLALANHIERQLVENDGEITPELVALLSSQEIAIPEKIDATVFILKRMEISAALFKAEADRYEKVAKGLSASQARLKDYVKSTMIERGLNDLIGNTNRFAISSAAPKLIIDDEALLPDVFTTPIITRRPNRELILSELKAGRPVTGARLEPVATMRIYAANKVGSTK